MMESLSVHEYMLIEDLPEDAQKVLRKLADEYRENLKLAHQEGYDKGYKSGLSQAKKGSRTI